MVSFQNFGIDENEDPSVLSVALLGAFVTNAVDSLIEMLNKMNGSITVVSTGAKKDKNYE